MSDELDQLIYVLSTLLPVCDHAPLNPVIEGESERKHLELLNDIALALTTKANGDVTAVTMKKNGSDIEFLYSKNTPCNGSLDVYLQAIKDVIANNDDVGIIQTALLKVVVSSCIEKFKKRVVKCKKAAEAYNNIAASEDYGKSKNPFEVVPKWHGLSSTDIITRFLNDLSNLDTTSIPLLKANVKKCMCLSQDACIIGLGKSLQDYPNLMKRVQKLGAYFGIAWRVKNLLKAPDFFKLRGNIRFIEVPPPSQQTILVSRNPVEILNENAAKSGADQVTLKDVELVYPDHPFSPTGSTKITVSARCELILALDSLNSASKPKSIEIGVSKRICWLSEQYVRTLNVTGLRVHVSGYNSKILAGWRMPPNTPSTVEADMRNLVEQEFEDLREGIIACRRSQVFLDKLREELIASGLDFDRM